MAQRLVRRLCDACKVEDNIAEDFAAEYNIEPDAKIYKAVGCKACNYSGFSGRQSIGELLIMNDMIKDMLKDTTDEHTISKALEAEHLVTISMQLHKMLLRGETSLDEAIRIGLAHA
jgi:general secretion pathway protein E